MADISIDKIRKQIDGADEQLVLLLAKRLFFIKQIAKYKAKNNIPICHPKREKEVISKARKIGKKYKLNEEYITDIFKRMIKESHSIQKSIIKKQK